MATISYGILVCNENRELDRLLSLLIPYTRKEDEVVVLVDEGKASKAVDSVLKSYENQIKVTRTPFNGNFAERRNELTKLCTKDWVFQIDADEVIQAGLLVSLPDILDSVEQGGQEMVGLTRINTVDGLTEKDIEKWHWNVNQFGWVNFPDYQVRLFKNNGQHMYEGAVHEHLTGNFTSLGLQCTLSILHPKSIKRQRQQNKLYESYNKE